MKLAALLFTLIPLVWAQDDPEDTATFSPYVVPTSTLVNSVLSSIDESVSFVFGIPCSNRTEWEVRKRAFASSGIKSDGEKFLGTPAPAWSDTFYLDYFTSGNRTLGQDMLLGRNNRILPLALAECFYWNGTFAAKLNEEILSIANQPTWVWPAHDINRSSFNGTEHFVDLGASYTSGILSMVVGLLDTAITPEVRSIVYQRLNERITTPVLRSIAAIPADKSNPSKNFWMNANSNWNAVCWAGTVIAASAALTSKADRATIYANAYANGNSYLNVFTADGWDTEGVQYWNLGFGEYVVLREALLRATRNRYDVLNTPVARESSRFPYEATLFTKNKLFVGPDFGDSPPEWSNISDNLKTYLDFALGKTPQQGIRIYPPTNKPPGIIIGMFSDFNPIVVLPSSTSNPVYTFNSLRSYFEGQGILIARQSTTASAVGLNAAFKLLGNEGIHSHNDIGSYEIFLSGIKLTGEPGGTSYSANSFGVNRFKSEFFNSIGHPVPRVNGKEQITAANRTFNIRSRPNIPYVVSTSFTDNVDTITYDLTGAYDVPSLTSLRRVIIFNRNTQNPFVSIEDTFSFSSDSTFETAIIAPWEWDPIANVFWNANAPNSQLLLTTFSTANTRFELSNTTISSAEYKRTIQRIVLTSTGSARSGSIGYKFTPRFVCQSTQFLNSTLNPCMVCTNGVPNVEATQCVCNAGYFWDSTQNSCVQCGQNSFSIVGSTSCGNCTKMGGTSPPGSSYCIATAGRFWNSAINAISWCPESTYSLPGALGCKTCASGTTKQPDIPWNPAQCTCSAGSYWNTTQESCIQCDANQFSLPGRSSCGSCQWGSSSPPGSSYCITPAGRFWNQTAAAVQNCPESTYSLPGAFQCKTCPSGTTKQPDIPWNPAQCTCSAGSYWNTTQESCIQCDANQVSSAGVGSCLLCPSGSTSNPGSSNCSTPAGKFWNSTRKWVDNCPENTYSLAGAFQCTACPAGSTGSQWKQYCTCNAGYAFNTLTGTCDICSPGTYSLSGWLQCNNCSAGSTSTAGASSCIINCVPGTYATAGSPTCMKCPPGTFSSTSKASSCTSCPSGKTSLEGSTSCSLAVVMDQSPMQIQAQTTISTSSSSSSSSRSTTSTTTSSSISGTTSSSTRRTSTSSARTSTLSTKTTSTTATRIV